MEGVCGVCYQHSQLYHVSGYNVLSCVRCSQQLSEKTPANTNQIPDRGGTGSGSAESGRAIEVITINESGITVNSEKIIMNTLEQDRKDALVSIDIEETIQKIENDIFENNGACPMCNKSFGRKSSLINHIRNHTAERKFICPYCKKGFTQAANLRNHERIHRNERPFVCSDCGKAFTQITNLNNHRRLHTGERPFVCIENNCGRSFAQVTNLNNHMKTHHKVQAYVCNQCPSRFAQVSQLNMHLMSHSGVQGLVCPHCPDKVYKQQGQLQQHLKQHGIEFPYECGQCDEKFLQFVHLEKHMKMHEEFRYKCTMCSSSFNQELLLKKHIQRHIDGRYLTCPVEGCNEGFTIKNQLTRHMKTHHSMNNYTKRISVKRLKMSNYVRSSQASGKFNCYFESCDGSFNAADTLNSHLRGVHGLSIVKNAGKKSKMDLMLFEQMKQQQLEQSSSAFSDGGGETSGDSKRILPDSNVHQQHIEGQRRTTSTVSQPIERIQEIQVHPDVGHLIDDEEQEQESHILSDSDGRELGEGHSAIMVKEPARTIGCSYCFHVFKTETALARHTKKFHSTN